MKTKNVYEVILVDPVWDNWEHLGFYEDLATASKALFPAIIQVLCDAAMNGLKLVMDDGIPFMPERDHPLSYEDWEDLFKRWINIPGDFLRVYPSTFCECIDRPYVSIEDIIEECFPPEINMAEPYDGDEYLCIRGFIHEFLEKIVDGLTSW